MITKISNPYIDIPKTFRIFVVQSYYKKVKCGKI